MMISIRGLSKADVLRVLYNYARPIGMGALRASPEPMTKEQAEEVIANGDDHKRDFGHSMRDGIYFDYVNGRPLKVDLSGDEFNPSLFDRDHGRGTAARAIAGLRNELGIPEEPREASIQTFLGSDEQ